MLVSTFEVLFKRLFPDPPSPGNPQGLVRFDRRVVQGYFLSLTNLENRDYTYSIQFHVSLPPASLPNPGVRLPPGNAVVFFDIAGSNQQAGIVSYGSPNVYGPSSPLRLFTVPAQQTALILFFPNPFAYSLFSTSDPEVEIRGYVTLTLPALRRSGSALSRFFFDAQSTSPVRVLLNPETRATFLPDATTDTTFSQTHSLLEVASGKGENLLDPDPSYNLLETLPVSLGDLVKRIDAEPNFLGSSVLAPEDRLIALLELLAQVRPSDKAVQQLNRLVEEAGIPLRLTPVNADDQAR